MCNIRIQINSKIMNATTTLTNGAIITSVRLQRSYQNNKSNKTAYYYFPQDTAHSTTATSLNGARDDSEKETLLKYTNNAYNCSSTTTQASAPHFDGDRLQLNTSPNTYATKALRKSNSYNGCTRPKATVLKQNSSNGRIATSLTDDNIGIFGSRGAFHTAKPPGVDLTSNMPNDYCNDAVIELNDECEFLMPIGSRAIGGGANGGDSNVSISQRTVRNTDKTHHSLCYQLYPLLNRKLLVGGFVLLILVFIFILFAYLLNDYTKQLIYWIESQNPWIIVAILLPLFVLVSFPIALGYFVLMVSSGYLFGWWKGLLIVIIGANVGVAVAHWSIRNIRHRIPIHKLIKNETGRAILRVISGPKAFKVVIFTRLTPIPFGLQNTIFAVSSINPRIYHTATFIGLLPAQVFNTYLGSTLRSIHEVFNNHGSAVTNYITFAAEVICGVVLMCWVLHKARKELAQTLLSDISNETKPVCEICEM